VSYSGQSSNRFLRHQATKDSEVALHSPQLAMLSVSRDCMGRGAHTEPKREEARAAERE
jgi:hypothetical protein